MTECACKMCCLILYWLVAAFSFSAAEYQHCEYDTSSGTGFSYETGSACYKLICFILVICIYFVDWQIIFTWCNVRCIVFIVATELHGQPMPCYKPCTNAVVRRPVCWFYNWQLHLDWSLRWLPQCECWGGVSLLSNAARIWKKGI